MRSSREADFRKGGYFDDMKAQALDALNAHIASMARSLKPLRAKGAK